MITDDKMIYNACPDCRKKVQDEPAGYRCETCNKVHSTMVPTYMLTVKVSDLSGSLYISFPRELGDAVMGQNAKLFQEFRERAKEEGDVETAMRNYMNEHVYNKQLQVLVKASADTFSRGADGEQRFKYYAAKVFPTNLVEEDGMLLKRLAAFKRQDENAEDVDME